MNPCEKLQELYTVTKYITTSDAEGITLEVGLEVNGSTLSFVCLFHNEEKFDQMESVIVDRIIKQVEEYVGS